MLDALGDDYKYLWAQYYPIPTSQFGHPIDFTHEREWRCIVNIKPQYGFTDLPKEGIPILLPWDACCNHEDYKFRIIVNTEEEVEILRNGLPSRSSNNTILDAYFKRLPETCMLALDTIRKLFPGPQIYAVRFEDLK
jgi:hypothetical protein